MSDTEDIHHQCTYLDHRRRSIVVGYLINTATHGLRNIGIASCVSHRTFWIITFLVMFGSMSYFVIMELLEFFAFPTQISINIVPIRDMHFPAVTVCNANPYRKDRMKEALDIYAKDRGIYLNDFDHEELAFPMLVEMFNEKESDELANLGFQLSDILLECSYNGINCSMNFIDSLSSVFGNCFTFNWKTPSNQLYTLGSIGSTSVLHEGLSMTFHVPRHLSFPWKEFEDGIILFLHDNNELPFIAKNSIRLGLGLAHTITYRKSQTVFLSKPFTNCTSAVDQSMRHIYELIYDPKSARQVAYSDALCYELCEEAYIFSQCSCILHVPFHMQYVFKLGQDQLVRANSCIPSTSDEYCALQARQRFSINGVLVSTWCSRCTPQCTHTHFTTDVSALTAPTDQQKKFWAQRLLNNKSKVLLPDDFAENYDRYMNENYLRVIVTCGSPYVTIHQQKAKVTLTDTFSAIGGQTGLWIGLSALSIMEFLELIYRLIVKQIHSWRVQREVQAEMKSSPNVIRN